MTFQPPLPKEHGAWAVVYAPFAVAVLFLGQFKLVAFLFLIAVSGVYLAHESLATIARLKSSTPAAAVKKREACSWLLVYVAVALMASVPLLISYHLWYLLPFGAILIVLLLLHIYPVSKRTERRTDGELLGVLGMTMSAPGACYVLTGRLGGLCLLLWAVNLLYFCSGVFYVKMRVSRFARKKDASLLTWQCAIYHAMLLVVVAALVWLGRVRSIAFLAFLPVIARAFWAMRPRESRLNLSFMGWSEVAFTFVFVLCLSAGLRPA